MDTDQFGPSVGPWTIEGAALASLQDPPAYGLSSPRLVYYLADQERQMGLAAQTLPVPPGPSSYRGGVDAGTLQAEWFPMLHVNVSPMGTPDRPDMLTYGQRWQVTVTATHGDDDPSVARMVAESYGAAVALLFTQYGSLGIGATDTTITQFPRPELLNPVNARQVCRTTVVFETYTAPVAVKRGPVSWPDDPYTAPGDWPQVTTVNVTVDAVSE